MTGIPIQLNNTIFNFFDWMEGNGEVDLARDALGRRTRK